MSLYSTSLADYLETQATLGADEPVLAEMEQRARTEGFPIVGRSSGRLIELQARMIQARRVMELGSGFGYSAAWFARAVGEQGEVICTDLEQSNAEAAEDYLTRAGLWQRITFRLGDALNTLLTVDGTLDIIYNDIDKVDYPEAWRNASERIRVGGLYICDNVLWDGRVADATNDEESTTAIREHNQMVATDGRYISAIAPVRDGILVALRIA